MAAASPAFAQDGGSQANNGQFDVGGDSVTIGGAAAYVPDYEGSDHYRLVPGPAALGSISGFSFSVVGNRASVDLIPNKPGPGIDFQLGPVAVINFDRTNHKSIDDPRVAALPERNTAIELGGYIGIGKTGVITSPYDKLSVSVSYRHDVSGVHDSGIWQPSVNYLTPLSPKAAVALFASAQHVERGYAQTYFGITPDDSIASGLPIYNAHGGWKNYTLGAAVTYSLTGNLLHGLKVVAGGTYSRLLNGFSYSPITRVAGSPNQWLGAVGLAYTF
ncbi:MipA/OmpV family protein [Sphingomonas koreensis]|nr:MipA/OmpV family protein [Sphingomonas koreensis]